MSAAELSSHQILEVEQTARELMSQTIGVLMRVRGVANRKELAGRMAPWISQSTLYSRLGRSTDWQATELRALAGVLDVPVAAFFLEPEPEQLAPLLGMSDTEFVKALVSATQNWKKLMASDLQVLPGGGAPELTARQARRGEQLAFRALYAVKS